MNKNKYNQIKLPTTFAGRIHKIGSEKISIIFDKRIAKGMLGAFAGAISSNAIARGTYFLKDKINEQILETHENRSNP